MKFSALAKVILTSLFFVFCFLLIKVPVSAQAQSQVPQAQQVRQMIDLNTNPDVPRNLHNFTQNVMIEVMSAMICQIAGVDVTNASQSCLGVDPQTKKIGFVKNGGGLIGVLQNSIVTLYTPPLHTGDYFKYLASNFGLAKPSLAASTSKDLGFNSISPLTNVWLTARNVAYLFFVLIFLIIGIGIMLRIHIDPRTVMTIQNQIPKIIIAIVLVTFSFAIAGLLIDLMYVISYLLLNIIASSDTTLKAAGVNAAASFAFRMISSTNPFDAANVATSGLGSGNPFPLQGLADIAAQPAGLVTGLVASMFNNTVGQTVTSVIGAIIGGLIAKTVSAPVSGIASLVTGALILGATFLSAGTLTLPAIAAAGTVSALVGNATGTIFAAGGMAAGWFGGATLLGYVAGIITFLIIMIAILVTLFRLWFQLIIAYISILLNIVFAPIWIMLGLVPSSKIGFSSWIRTLIGNLSCFPTALVMFLLARVFIDAFATGDTKIFVAPLVGNPADTHGLAGIIGMGIFLMTPSAVTSVKNAISGSAGITFGGVGQGISAGVAVPMAGIKGVVATQAKTTKPGYARGWKALFGAG
jgi:hypothetical protein